MEMYAVQRGMHFNPGYPNISPGTMHLQRERQRQKGMLERGDEIMISDFAKSYLAMQGVALMPPCPRNRSQPIIDAREEEYEQPEPGTNEYAENKDDYFCHKRREP
jgi:hypothetical protein